MVDQRMHRTHTRTHSGVVLTGRHIKRQVGGEWHVGRRHVPVIDACEQDDDGQEINLTVRFFQYHHAHHRALAIREQQKVIKMQREQQIKWQNREIIVGLERDGRTEPKQEILEKLKIKKYEITVSKSTIEIVSGIDLSTGQGTVGLVWFYT